MPVQKFRSLREAERALWCETPDEHYLDRLERWWRLSDQLSPRSFPTGVVKYRNLEEAQQDRKRWLAEQVDAQQMRLGLESSSAAEPKSDLERRKKFEEKTLDSIRSFDAADRLPRDELHRR